MRRVFKSGFLYQLCSKAYLEVLENYNEVSDVPTASPRMFAYQKTRKHPSKKRFKKFYPSIQSRSVIGRAWGHRERGGEDTNCGVLQQPLNF